MPKISGAVYLTAAKDRAVFLTRDDLAIVRDMLHMLEARPTVAGPPLDTEALARLSRAVDFDDGDDAPADAIVLSAGEQECLELLRDQSLIRDKLPLRIRRTCAVCGDERMVNPARQAKAAAEARSKGIGQAFLAGAQLAGDGHPYLGALRFILGGLGLADESAPAEEAVCARCDGDEFEMTPVTFCPGCRAVRDESVLRRCPECDYEFLSRRTGDPLWTSPPEAIEQSKIARNRTMLEERAGEFESGLRPGQLAAFAEALRADEQLLGMCRCGLPGEVGRYVALLFTTEQLVWARKSPLSDLTSGTVRWRDVRAAWEHGNRSNRYDQGIRIEVADGAPLVFNDFRGVGVSFGDPPLWFAAGDLLQLTTRLHQQHGHPGRALAAAPAPGPPMPEPPPPAVPRHAARSPLPATAYAAPPIAPLAPLPPPHAGAQQPIPPLRPGGQPHPLPLPGWHADPWRAARLRWWDGRQWTGHTSA